MEDRSFVPGPLHPDLFDGETPIMLPCNLPPALFRVEVCWREGDDIECRKLNVVACTHEEAAQLALELAQRSDQEGAEVVDVQRGRRRPTTAMIEAWAKRMEVRK